MTIEHATVEQGLAVPRDLVGADGGALSVVGIDGAVVHLRLELRDASCAECVMPRAFLEPLVLDAVRAAAPGVEAVVIDDPRETESD